MANVEAQMTHTATFEIAGGTRIVAPDSLDLITSYVLREQLDWFEDELPFLRRVLLPGQKAIDVGANYGVYTLSIARVVGADGAVWAFEPASATASVLAQGISTNGFGHVFLESSALSSERGSAQLSLHSSSELNALVHGNQAASFSESVRVDTLDDCMDRFGWRDIDFVKIDAEGEESNIIKGGRRFLSEQAPLILYEVKNAMDVHYELETQFAALGYSSYRLVPGLNLLVPFDRTAKPDAYLLNLFCCKPDRAATLMKRGLLIDSLSFTEVNQARLSELLDAQGHQHGWRQMLTKLPYGALVEDRWINAGQRSDSGKLGEAMACFAISRNEQLQPIDRFIALDHSYRSLLDLCAQNPIKLRHASLARVARAHGSRSVAVDSLSQLSNRIAAENRIDVDEPFLAPGERFDTVAPGANFGAWLLAGVLEELERLAAFSSFFTGADTRPRLEGIKSLGYASAEMLRRLDLVQRRFAPR
jgi:FkbM family methyltransferase